MWRPAALVVAKRARAYQARVVARCSGKGRQSSVHPPLGAILEVTARTFHIVLCPLDCSTTLDDSEVELWARIEDSDAARGGRI